MDQKIILVVDDTPANIALICSLLKGTYKTKIAPNGQKALSIARSERPPDLILLDINMPDLDGYEVCRQLKADQRTRHIPIIFLTGLTGAEEEEKGLALGAVDYIFKPLDPPTLLDKVANQLRI